MKEGTKSKEDKEPTLGTVLKSVNTHLVEIEEMMGREFVHVHERIDEEFTDVSGRFEKIERSIRALHTGQETLTEKVGDVHRRVVNLEHRVEDIRESLTDITNAEEKDAKATINHEYRISHLEKLGGIKSVPAKHLT